MKTLISFDFNNMKETIKIGKKSTTQDLGSSFLKVLSLDVDKLEQKYLHKTDFTNIAEIEHLYKALSSIEPLLFIDESDLVKHLEMFLDAEHFKYEYEFTLEQLSQLLNTVEISNNTVLKNYVMQLITKLKRDQKRYTTIGKRLPKYAKNTFTIILNRVKLYQLLVDMCFIDKSHEYFEGYSNLSPLKKCLFCFISQKRDINLFKKLPACIINYDFDLSPEEEKQFKKLTKTDPNSAIKMLFNTDISSYNEYECKNLEEYLQLYFHTCLTHGINIKKCANCNKYFIAYQRSDEKYCNRISPDDPNKTCKQFANAENWKNNLNSDYALKTYRRIYMAKQMQTRRNPDNVDAINSFANWKKQAQIIRNNYIHGNIDQEEFLNWLNNN